MLEAASSPAGLELRDTVMHGLFTGHPEHGAEFQHRFEPLLRFKGLEFVRLNPCTDQAELLATLRITSSVFRDMLLNVPRGAYVWAARDITGLDQAQPLRAVVIVHIISPQVCWVAHHWCSPLFCEDRFRAYWFVAQVALACHARWKHAPRFLFNTSPLWTLPESYAYAANQYIQGKVPQNPKTQGVVFPWRRLRPRERPVFVRKVVQCARRLGLSVSPQYVRHWTRSCRKCVTVQYGSSGPAWSGIVRVAPDGSRRWCVTYWTAPLTPAQRTQLWAYLGRCRIDEVDVLCCQDTQPWKPELRACAATIVRAEYNRSPEETRNPEWVPHIFW